MKKKEEQSCNNKTESWFCCVRQIFCGGGSTSNLCIITAFVHYSDGCDDEECNGVICEILYIDDLTDE